MSYTVMELKSEIRPPYFLLIALKCHRPDKLNLKTPLGFLFSKQMQHVADCRCRKVLQCFPPLTLLMTLHWEGGSLWVFLNLNCGGNACAAVSAAATHMQTS